MSQWFLSYSLYCCWVHFCVFFSQLSEHVWKLAEELSLQSASKRYPSFGPPANGNKSNAKKSPFCPNRNSTRTICHWSVIPRSFSVVSNSAKRDANGFFKVLLLSSHLWISRNPVQKSKFGACTVTGYCSFNSSPNLPLPQGTQCDHCLSKNQEGSSYIFQVSNYDELLGKRMGR